MPCIKHAQGWWAVWRERRYIRPQTGWYFQPEQLSAFWSRVSLENGMETGMGGGIRWSNVWGSMWGWMCIWRAIERWSMNAILWDRVWADKEVAAVKYSQRHFSFRSLPRPTEQVDVNNNIGVKPFFFSQNNISPAHSPEIDYTSRPRWIWTSWHLQ